MACALWGLTLVLGSLSLLASGKSNLCSDANDENCLLTLNAVNIFNPRRREPYRPIYRRNVVLDLSNHALTRLIQPSRTTIQPYTGYPTKPYWMFGYTTTKPTTTTPDTRRKISYPEIDLNGITDLILSNNDVSVEELVAIFHDQRYDQQNSLKYLDLSRLNISWLPDNMFEHFPNIQVLKFNGNPLYWYMNNVKYAIKQLKNLKALDISGCSLSSLPFDLFEDIHITKLNLSSNLFTSVPRLPHSLQQLSIDNNSISVLDDRSFNGLYLIEEISAENCGIHTITGDTFSTNYRLQKLNLKNNQIRHLLPNDIYVKRTVVSLDNNPWDCTCRNIWLMRETRNEFTILDKPYALRCGTPTMYAGRTLYDVEASVEMKGNCDQLFFNLFHIPTMTPESPRTFGSFMTRKAVINFFIVVGLLAIFSVIATMILIRKFNSNSRVQTYKPLHKIWQNKGKRLLNEENIQHM